MRTPLSRITQAKTYLAHSSTGRPLRSCAPAVVSNFVGLFLLATAQQSYAEIARPEYPAPTVGTGSIMQMMFSLALVIAAIMAVAWLLKRTNLTRQVGGEHLKVIAGVAIGQRERIVLVEVDDTWLVVGVGPGQIRTLHTLPRIEQTETGSKTAPPEIPFQVWLKRFTEKKDEA